MTVNTVSAWWIQPVRIQLNRSEDLNQAQTDTFSYEDISGQRNESVWLWGESGLNTDVSTGCRKDVTLNRDGHATVGDQR